MTAPASAAVDCVRWAEQVFSGAPRAPCGDLTGKACFVP